MFDKIDLFNLAGAAARHASARQQVIAGNVANADTPGYVARDLKPFDASFEPGDQGMRRTRSGHLGSENGGLTLTAEVERSAMSPNGNAVSLEDQMVRSVDAKREHDLALSIYRSSLGILRSSLGRR